FHMIRDEEYIRTEGQLGDQEQCAFVLGVIQQVAFDFSFLLQRYQDEYNLDLTQAFGKNMTQNIQAVLDTSKINKTIMLSSFYIDVLGDEISLTQAAVLDTSKINKTI
ncbi:hypothetical protein ACJX0J_017646, partial [Zea mays]